MHRTQRNKCKACGHDGYEKIGFVEGNRSYTDRLATYVVDLLRVMSIQEVSRKESWS